MVQATHYEVVSKVEHNVDDVFDQAEEECNHSNCHTETGARGGQWSLTLGAQAKERKNHQ